MKGGFYLFGYVTVYKELLNESDYLTFKAYYCGLCRSIGRRCSQMSRLGLSYDLTFLAIVLSSVSNDEPVTESGPCIAHPFKKRESIKEDNAIDYAADMGVILDYLKLLDDWKDDRSIKSLFGMLVFRRGMKKARKRHKECVDEITSQLSRLSILEKANSSDIDECADCFAKILELLFTPPFIEDKNQRRVLSWLGYNIGRWIYVIDAVNDMEKDHNKGNYNPFNVEFGGVDYAEWMKKIKSEKQVTLTFTLENAASAFELLDIKKNHTLIEGMIYDCLKMRQTQILADMKGNNNEPI